MSTTDPRVYVVGLPVVVTVSDAGVSYAVDTTETGTTIRKDDWSSASDMSDRQRDADVAAIEADHQARLVAATTTAAPRVCPECGGPLDDLGECDGSTMGEGFPSFDDVAAVEGLDPTLRSRTGTGPHGWYTWADLARAYGDLLAAQRTAAATPAPTEAASPGAFEACDTAQQRGRIILDHYGRLLDVGVGDGFQIVSAITDLMHLADTLPDDDADRGAVAVVARAWQEYGKDRAGTW